MDVHYRFSNRPKKWILIDYQFNIGNQVDKYSPGIILCSLSLKKSVQSFFSKLTNPVVINTTSINSLMLCLPEITAHPSFFYFKAFFPHFSHSVHREAGGSPAQTLSPAHFGLHTWLLCLWNEHHPKPQR